MYKADGNNPSPLLIVQQYNDFRAGEIVLFNGEHRFLDIYTFIRTLKPLFIEKVKTYERFEQLRAQVSHHLFVGLLYDKVPFVTEDVHRFLFTMQSKNPLLKFVIVEDKQVVPNEIRNAVSPLVMVRHPVFAPLFGLFEDIVISYREDSKSINDK
jgi:hypothetical protein